MIHPIKSFKAHTQNFLLKYFIHTPYGHFMKKIHNTHFGESCFVIGNGPSLSADDLSELHRRKIATFAVNRIFKIFPQTEWRPTYYVNTDNVLIRDCLEDINKLNCLIKFIPLQNKYYLNTKVKGAHYFFRNDKRENDPKDMFSLDCTSQVNIRGTVTIDCIQLAIHMGYRNIYLLGIDHNFDKVITENGEIVIDSSVKNYFCEKYDDDVSKEVYHNLGVTTKAYQDIQVFCKKYDINVYNASRKTKLDAFEKITFEEAINNINGE